MLLLKSRIHKLNSFLPCTHVKRDDELSFGMSGCKVRKISGLLPHLPNKKISALGGANSNFLASLSQVFNEREVDYHLYLRKAYFEAPSGKIIKQMAEGRFTTVERSEWSSLKLDGFVIPEGGVCTSCFEGAKSLADDIPKDQFKHIYIDAGSGLTACALIARALELKMPWHIHVLLLAEDASGFEKILLKFIGYLPNNYTAYRPKKKSFGPISQEERIKALEISRREGILLDPLYSAPLFLFFKEKVEPDSLIIHSGCGLSTL